MECRGSVSIRPSDQLGNRLAVGQDSYGDAGGVEKPLLRIDPEVPINGCQQVVGLEPAFLRLLGLVGGGADHLPGPETAAAKPPCASNALTRSSNELSPLRAFFLQLPSASDMPNPYVTDSTSVKEGSEASPAASRGSDMLCGKDKTKTKTKRAIRTY